MLDISFLLNVNSLLLVSAFAFRRRCDWRQWNRVIEVALTILVDVTVSVEFSHAQVFDLNACFSLLSEYSILFQHLGVYAFIWIQQYSVSTIERMCVYMNTVFCFNNWASVRLHEYSILFVSAFIWIQYSVSIIGRMCVYMNTTVFCFNNWSSVRLYINRTIRSFALLVILRSAFDYKF